MLSNILLPPTEQNVIIPRTPASVLLFTRYSSEPPQTRSTLTNSGQWFPPHAALVLSFPFDSYTEMFRQMQRTPVSPADLLLNHALPWPFTPPRSVFPLSLARQN